MYVYIYIYIYTYSFIHAKLARGTRKQNKPAKATLPVKVTAIVCDTEYCHSENRCSARDANAKKSGYMTMEHVVGK